MLTGICNEFSQGRILIHIKAFSGVILAKLNHDGNKVVGAKDVQQAVHLTFVFLCQQDVYNIELVNANLMIVRRKSVQLASHFRGYGGTSDKERPHVRKLDLAVSGDTERINQGLERGEVTGIDPIDRNPSPDFSRHQMTVHGADAP